MCSFYSQILYKMMDAMDTLGLIHQNVQHHVDTLCVEVLRTANSWDPGILGADGKYKL